MKERDTRARQYPLSSGFMTREESRKIGKEVRKEHADLFEALAEDD